MEDATKELLSEIKEGRVIDMKLLDIDGSKYVLEDRNKRKVSLFTSRFETELKRDHCYRFQWVNDQNISIVKPLGIAPEETKSAVNEADEVPF